MQSLQDGARGLPGVRVTNHEVDLDCSIDAVCLRRVGRELGAEHVLGIQLSGGHGGAVGVHLTLVNVASGRVEGNSTHAWLSHLLRTEPGYWLRRFLREAIGVRPEREDEEEVASSGGGSDDSSGGGTGGEGGSSGEGGDSSRDGGSRASTGGGSGGSGGRRSGSPPDNPFEGGSEEGAEGSGGSSQGSDDGRERHASNTYTGGSGGGQGGTRDHRRDDADDPEEEEEEEGGVAATGEGWRRVPLEERERPPTEEERARALQLLREGVAERAAGRDEHALELFQESDNLNPSAVAMAQIGMAEQALGRWLDANAHMMEALDDRDDVWILSNQQALEGVLATIRTRLGRIRVIGGVEGAELKINDISVGTLPIEEAVWAEAGVAFLSVRRDGYIPYEREVRVSAGRVTRQEVRMQESRGLVIGLDGSITIPPPPPPPPPDIAEQVFWSLAIPAVALSIVGAGTGGVALTGYEAYLNCTTVQCVLDGRDTGRQLTLATDIILPFAGAFAIGAMIVYLVEPDMFENSGEDEEGDDEEAGLDLRIAPWLTGHEGGLSIGGSF